MKLVSILDNNVISYVLTYYTSDFGQCQTCRQEACRHSGRRSWQAQTPGLSMKNLHHEMSAQLRACTHVAQSRHSETMDRRETARCLRRAPVR